MRPSLIKRSTIALAALGIAITCTYAQTSKAQGTAPPKDASYLLADGTVQIVGFDDMAGIIDSINALFSQSHPGIKFKYIPTNSVASFHSLVFDETAFSPVGMEFSANVAAAYDALVHADPFAIRIAHGSLNPSAKLSPLAIIINKHNPLENLTGNQLTHIFTVGGRKPDIVYWSQAGVKGDLATREVHPYGLPNSDHYPAEDVAFGTYMFIGKLGGGHNAPRYEMLQTYSEVVKRVAEDPQAIGITALNRITPDVKIVGITGNGWSKPALGTAQEIAAGTYPYDRFLYIYVRRLPGQPIQPFQKDYLKLVLSPQGQQAIASEAHGYIPLNAAEVAAELDKLE